MTHRAVAIATVLATFAGAVLGAAAPASADPTEPTTVAQVYKQLDTLRAQQSALAADYDRAAAEATRAQQASTAAQRTLAEGDAALAQSLDVIASLAVAQYEGGSFSTTGDILTSATQQSYLADLSTLSMFSSITARATDQIKTAQHRRQAAADAAAHAVARAAKLRDDLAAKKRTAAQQVTEYAALLAALTAKQQTGYTTSVARPTTPADRTALATSVSASAGVPKSATGAATFAVHQLGRGYVMNTAGPATFDCSGLTMAAYHSVGVALPHNAAAQYAMLQAQGKALAYHGIGDLVGKLRVGDLIFYYPGITHVVIYIGGGVAVSAADEELGVISIQVAGWDAGNIVGAARVVS